MAKSLSENQPGTTMSGKVRPRGEFIPPGYQNRRDAIMDFIRFGPEALPNSEFMALLFLMERSVAYGKSRDAASMSQMTEGVYNRKTGVRIRGASGIAKATCAKVNAALEQMGLIKRRPRYRENGARDSTEYEIQWPELTKLYRKQVTENQKPARPRRGYVSPADRQAPVHEIDRLPVHAADGGCPPEREQQSRSYRDHPQQKRSKQRKAASKTSDLVDYSDESRSLGKNKPSFSNSSRDADDDEAPPPQPARAATPVVRSRIEDDGEECKARIAERHPPHLQHPLDPQYALEQILEEVQKHGLDLAKFLEFDSKATTSPRSLTNPMGHYKALVEKLARKKLDAASRELIESESRRQQEELTRWHAAMKSDDDRDRWRELSTTLKDEFPLWFIEGEAAQVGAFWCISRARSVSDLARFLKQNGVNESTPGKRIEAFLAITRLLSDCDAATVIEYAKQSGKTMSDIESELGERTGVEIRYADVSSEAVLEALRGLSGPDSAPRLN